ncbi:tripartite tricarboxylate transporter substrate binding protein [Variovorax sp. J22R133]|uniref:Bug family tripartite tricarboxylate transporter substrate binding protein n=1 Tax=Variovorax brevis TaxID=3053503 RepID=UPI0025768F97|nr:tripartite tricarboxylate transporter substrate binding protein [Variovorax sp. J22R133]MDM0110906.1 tripartite tricarboxylate transporter substrate binding protein [Variovorax sp. J22R133]
MFKFTAVFAMALGISGGACAQTYPTKPVTLVVPFAAGGTVNLMGRLIAQRMGDVLGQPVIVDNRAGAGGTIGAGYVAKAPADGYTLLLGSMGQAVQPLLYKKLPFDGTKAFINVATFAAVPNVLAVSRQAPAQSVAELVAYAKANPGKLNMGSAGIGSINHLLGAIFMDRAHVSFTHIPYKGASSATTDLQAGQIQVVFANLPNVLPYAKAGSVRILGIAADKRSSVIPNVPTLAESGVNDVVVKSWYSVMAPAGTPLDVVKKLQDTVVGIANEKSFAAHLADQGAYPFPGSTVDATELMEKEVRRWADIVRNGNIQMD